jgi:hypothetical protein
MPGHPDTQKITVSIVLGWLGIILPLLFVVGLVVFLVILAGSAGV